MLNNIFTKDSIDKTLKNFSKIRKTCPWGHE